MKKIKILISSLSLVALSACSSNNCEFNTVEDFDTFLGINETISFTDLKKRFGKPSEKNVREEEQLIYYAYKQHLGYSIYTAVDASSMKVQSLTIMFYTSSYFDKNLAEFSTKYKLNDCDKKAFGLTELELIKFLGLYDFSYNDIMGEKRVEYYKKDGTKIAYGFQKDDATDVNGGPICNFIDFDWTKTDK